jgi:hypothetical protein
MEPFRFDDLEGWQQVLDRLHGMRGTPQIYEAPNARILPFNDDTHMMRKPRRRLIGQALGVVAGWLGVPNVDAKQRHKRKRRKPKPNAFGCLDVGDACKNADQCCSGICQGKKGKKRCRAHDTGGCQPTNLCSFFDVEPVSCTTSSGVEGSCGTTTGNAGYCGGGGDCFPCKKDSDCHEVCGPQAACVQCPEECDVGTVCAGPDGVVCPL